MSEWELPDDERDESPRPFAATLPPGDPGAWPTVAAYLECRELDPTLARANGWYSMRDDETIRVVIPATSRNPSNRFWQARKVSGPSPKRYLSPAAARGDALVLIVPTGIPHGIALVEGPMDALAAGGCGWFGIALLGSTPPEAAVTHAVTRVTRLRQQHRWLPVAIIADADEAGLRAAARIARRLPPPFLVLVPEAKDLAALPRQARQDWLQRFA